MNKESFKEMVKFDEFVMSQKFQAPPGNETANIEAGEPPTMYSFTDLCKPEKPLDQIKLDEWAQKCNSDEVYCLTPRKPRCYTTPKPLDFVYEVQTDSWNIDRYSNDRELVAKIQTGKGDERFIYDEFYKNIYIQIFFAGMTPDNEEQDLIFGDSSVTGALVARYFYQLDN